MFNAVEVGTVKVGFLKGLEGVFYLLGHEVSNLCFTVGHSIFIFHISDMIGTTTQSTKFFHSGIKFPWCRFDVNGG